MSESYVVECPACGHKHRPGTLFCTECGVYLPKGGPVGTEPLLDGELLGSHRETWTKDVFNPEAGSTQPRLSVLSTGRQIQLPEAAEILIGRLDAAHGIFPDVDLTPDGGLESGVSRRHCKIHRQGSMYFIEDIGSANGTSVSGKPLTAYLPHVLKDGDEIQLGQIKMQVTIPEEE
jgi:hypothetical protein